MIAARSFSASAACSATSPPAQPSAHGLPGDPVVGQLARRQQVEGLVVRLEQQPPAVEQLVGQLAAVAADPSLEHEVVVAAGHLQRVELQRAEPIDYGQDALRRGGQRARRREQMADGQEAARHGEADLLGHGAIVRARGVRRGRFRVAVTGSGRAARSTSDGSDGERSARGQRPARAAGAGRPPAGRVQLAFPGPRRADVRQGERQRLPPAVDDEQQVVVEHRPAALVAVGVAGAVEVGHDAARPAGAPVRVGHGGSGRREPCDVVAQGARWRSGGAAGPDGGAGWPPARGRRPSRSASAEPQSNQEISLSWQ